MLELNVLSLVLADAFECGTELKLGEGWSLVAEYGGVWELRNEDGVLDVLNPEAFRSGLELREFLQQSIEQRDTLSESIHSAATAEADTD